MARIQCPVCREEIQEEALKCRFCGALRIEPGWIETYRNWIADQGRFESEVWPALTLEQKERFRAVVEVLSSEPLPARAQTKAKAAPVARRKGVSLTGCLVAVCGVAVALFVLFAILIPNFQEALEKAREKRAEREAVTQTDSPSQDEKAPAVVEQPSATAAPSKADAPPPEGMLSFSEEARRVTSTVPCRETKIQGGGHPDWGRLYWCLGGNAPETVKLFINEAPGTNGVKNFKLMWNDWNEDQGYGVHADEETARSFLTQLAALYAPGHESALSEVFFARHNSSLVLGDFEVSYRWTRGPAIDEHLLTLTPSPGAEARERARVAQQKEARERAQAEFLAQAQKQAEQRATELAELCPPNVDWLSKHLGQILDVDSRAGRVPCSELHAAAYVISTERAKPPIRADLDLMRNEWIKVGASCSTSPAASASLQAAHQAVLRVQRYASECQSAGFGIVGGR